jgi:hypothetical protein
MMGTTTHAKMTRVDEFSDCHISSELVSCPPDLAYKQVILLLDTSPQAETNKQRCTMDFADDFTYFTLEEILQEARRLYGQNKYVAGISLDKAVNDEPSIKMVIRKPKNLKLTQLGLPLRFRNMPVTLLQASNDPLALR